MNLNASSLPPLARRVYSHNELLHRALSMKRTERLSRVARLCCHCLRNIAFYRAGWRSRQIRVARPFWINANSNCLDVAVLEWCKLFADSRGKHHWKRVIPDRARFLTGMCQHLGMSSKEFRAYATSVLRYRNRFVAHLDDDRTMQIPMMRIARSSAAYLLEYLLRGPESISFLLDAPESASEFYGILYRHAYQEYGRGHEG